MAALRTTPPTNGSGSTRVRSPTIAGISLHTGNYQVVRLFIAENEPPLPGNLPRFLTSKDVLWYRVIVHMRNTVDYDPSSPSPPPSLPSSDDGDNGHDGNPERHHFSCGIGPRHHC
jgi:hypothetical protein